MFVTACWPEATKIVTVVVVTGEGEFVGVLKNSSVSIISCCCWPEATKVVTVVVVTGEGEFVGVFKNLSVSFI